LKDLDILKRERDWDIQTVLSAEFGMEGIGARRRLKEIQRAAFIAIQRILYDSRRVPQLPQNTTSRQNGKFNVVHGFVLVQLPDR
jgi:hypothetical protein